MFASVLFLGSETWRGWTARSQQLHDTGTALANLATSLAQHAEDTIELADTALAGLVERLNVDGTSPQAFAGLDRLLPARVAALPRVGSLTVYGADGTRLASTLATGPARGADQAALAHHRDGPGQAPFVGPPVRDQAAGHWTIAVSRRLEHSDGRFAGVALATVAIAHPMRQYAAYDVALLPTSGTQPAGHPDVGTAIDQDHLPPESAGVFSGVSTVDGVRRWHGYQRSARYPLVVIASTAEADALATWRFDARVNVAIALALTGIVVLLGLLLARQAALRQAAEARLHESDAGFRLLAEHANDMVSRIGPDGTRRYASPASLRIYGLPPEAFIGHRLAEFARPEDQVAVEAFTQRLLGAVVEEDAVTFRTSRPDGANVWVEASARLLRDLATGAADGYVAISRDVTERVRLEAERDAHAAEVEVANAQLERLVRHLARARDRADQASQAKSRFLASMSHELRTPLNGILGYAQLLQLEGKLDSAQEHRVKAMLEAGQHLLGMINRVLDLSEIEADRIDLCNTSLDPGEVAKACLDQVRPAAETKGIALRLTATPGTPRGIVADATRVRQVLLNLLGNAVKFTAEGLVELRLQPTGGGGLRVEIADTGPGIPSEKRQHLFQDFERLGADVTAVEGAGLGLAISARLMQSMGGRIGHEDNPGGGSLFWLELPEAAVVEARIAATPDVPGDVSRDVPEPSPLPARPLSILVVDDVAMNRDVARSFLRAAGHEVVCAEGGAETVVMNAAADFDAVLMDVRMPGVDGLESSRRIRALAGPRGRVPIVALTAQAFVEQVAECRQAGMDGHLAKPFTQGALLDTIGQAIRGRAGAAADAAAPPARAVPAPGSNLLIFDPVAFERTAAFLPPSAVTSYLHTLATRGAALLVMLRETDALGLGAGQLAEAAHSMAGSAGMFGFDRVSVVARLFEQAVETASPEAEALAGHLIRVLEPTLDALRQHATAGAEAAA